MRLKLPPPGYKTVTSAELRGKVAALCRFTDSVVGPSFAPAHCSLITDYVLRHEALAPPDGFWSSIIFRPWSLLMASPVLRLLGRKIMRLEWLEIG